MPEAAPFEVRNSPGRMKLQAVFGAGVVVLGLVLLSPAGVVVGVVFVALGGLTVMVSLRALANRDPALAADDTGLWLQAFGGADGVRFLPWDEVQAVFVNHYSKRPPARLLCVLPRRLDDLYAAEPDHEATLRRSVSLVGAPFSVNLVAASVPDERALSALDGLSAGRANIRR